MGVTTLKQGTGRIRLPEPGVLYGRYQKSNKREPIGIKMVAKVSQRLTNMHQQIDLVSGLHKRRDGFLEYRDFDQLFLGIYLADPGNWLNDVGG